MKYTVAAALIALAGAATADPVSGTWKTESGDDGTYGHVQIAPCGSAICGTIVAGFDASGTAVGGPNIGRQMIWDMQAQGSGNYARGKIWAPDRDKTYNSKMQLSGNRLKVSGCVLGICRSQTWSRVN